MKAFFAALLVFSAVSVQAQASCDAEAIAPLQNEVEKASDLFNVGEITRTEVAQAQFNLAQAQSKCACETAKSAAAQVVKGMKEEAKVGQRNRAEVNAAIKQQNDLKKICR